MTMPDDMRRPGCLTREEMERRRAELEAEVARAERLGLEQLDRQFWEQLQRQERRDAFEAYVRRVGRRVPRRPPHVMREAFLRELAETMRAVEVDAEADADMDGTTEAAAAETLCGMKGQSSRSSSSYVTASF